MANPIKKIRTLKGTVAWQIDGRKFNASPSRPQFPNKELAEAALARMIEARGAGLNPTRRDVSFEMQVETYLKRAEHVSKLAGKTLRNVKSCIDVHLTPAFGKKRIVDLNSGVLMGFLTEKSAEKKTDGTLRFKTATVRGMKLRLSAIFDTAVTDGIISENPVDRVKLGGTSRALRAEKDEAVPKECVFTQEEQRALLRYCAEMDGDLGDYLHVLLKTGCRPGEARALKWGDVHADYIRIEKNLDDRSFESATKTGVRRRSDMTPILKKVLAARKARRPGEGHGVEDTDHIFGNGSPVSARNISRRFDAAMDACKIENHKLYDCRHTVASVLYNRSHDVILSARQIGDAPATFLKYYAHFVPDSAKLDISILD